MATQIFCLNNLQKVLETFIAEFDKNYEEFWNLCREAWKVEYNYFCIDNFKRKMNENTVFVTVEARCYFSPHM